MTHTKQPRRKHLGTVIAERRSFSDRVIARDPQCPRQVPGVFTDAVIGIQLMGCEGRCPLTVAGRRQ
jgi:hypothetical protein